MSLHESGDGRSGVIPRGVAAQMSVERLLAEVTRETDELVDLACSVPPPCDFRKVRENCTLPQPDLLLVDLKKGNMVERRHTFQTSGIDWTLGLPGERMAMEVDAALDASETSETETIYRGKSS